MPATLPAPVSRRRFQAGGVEDALTDRTSYGQWLAETKWAPYVQNLSGRQKENVAILLENTHFWLSNMTEDTKILNVGNFEKYAFPLIRAVMPNLIAEDLVSVQPMEGPTSLVFYLDFIRSKAKGKIAEGSTAFDALGGPSEEPDYSSDVVPGEVIGTGNGSATQFTATLSHKPVRRGTLLIRAGTVTGYDDGLGNITGTGIAAGSTVNYTTGAVTVNFSTAPGTDVDVTASYRWDFEGSDETPQIDLQLTSAVVVAEERKLRARWSLEAQQNLSALHGLEAEAELLAVLAESIRFDIDRQILEDLENAASAGTVTWDKAVPSGISYSEHKLSFFDAVVEASNKIFQATKRGVGTWIVAGLTMANIIEAHPQFKPDPAASKTQSTAGAHKIGTFAGRWDVYKDPFRAPETGLMGYKGNSFVDAGYVYAPWLPIITTPTVVLDDFIARRGVASRYGTKVVNGRFYCKLTVTNP